MDWVGDIEVLPIMNRFNSTFRVVLEHIADKLVEMVKEKGEASETTGK